MHDCRGALLNPCGGFQRTFSFRHPQRDQQIGSFQIKDGEFADQWKNMQFQRAQNFGSMGFIPADIGRHPFTGDIFKSVAAFTGKLLLLFFLRRDRCQSFEPLGLISRYKPCASLSFQDLSSVRIEVWVRDIVGVP